MMSQDVERILEAASHARKRDWRVYEGFKQQLFFLNLSAREYERAIFELARILRV